jgi:excisionase family DNA binding protein
MAEENRLHEASRSSVFENRIEREWLSTEEAAHFLCLSPNALRIMVHRGQIQVFKIGRRLRFRLKDCHALFVKKGA